MFKDFSVAEYSTLNEQPRFPSVLAASHLTSPFVRRTRFFNFLKKMFVNEEESPKNGVHQVRTNGLLGGIFGDYGYNPEESCKFRKFKLS